MVILLQLGTVGEWQRGAQQLELLWRASSSPTRISPNGQSLIGYGAEEQQLGI